MKDERCILCGAPMSFESDFFCWSCTGRAEVAPVMLGVAGLIAAIYAWREWRLDADREYLATELAGACARLDTTHAIAWAAVRERDEWKQRAADAEIGVTSEAKAHEDWKAKAEERRIVAIHRFWWAWAWKALARRYRERFAKALLFMSRMENVTVGALLPDLQLASMAGVMKERDALAAALDELHATIAHRKGSKRGPGCESQCPACEVERVLMGLLTRSET